MKNLLTFVIFVLVGFLLLGILPAHGEAEIYDSVVRLHVLANSDSEYDQSLKLKVRDAVLAEASEIVSGCNTRNEACTVLAAQKDRIQSAAAEVVRKEGADYTVEVMLGEEKYPTKSYQSVCFPSGRYMSLQVRIGKAEGQNWWCVLFPNLCLAPSKKEDAENLLVQTGLTPDQYKIITESDGTKYKLRFKFLEVIEDIFAK